MSDADVRLWLDPGAKLEHATISSGVASQINDRSFNANHATATGAAKPSCTLTSFDGAPGWVQDGTNNWLQLTSLITDAKTIIGAYYSTAAKPFAPILGSSSAEGFLDLVSDTVGLQLLGNNTALGVRRGHTSINGIDYKSSVCSVFDVTTGGQGLNKPTAACIMTVQGDYADTGANLRFSNVGQDRGVTSRRDPAKWGMLFVSARKFTMFERWAVERWMAREMMRRGCTTITTNALKRRLLICLGDSMTNAAQAGARAQYPDLCLGGSAVTNHFAVANLGIGGTTLPTIYSTGSSHILPTILAAKAAGVTHITAILQAGTNDIAGGNLNGVVWTNTQAVVTMLYGYGVDSVIDCPIPPRSNGGLVAGFNTERNAVNASKLALGAGAASSYCNYYVDGLATDVNIGLDGCSNNATYYYDAIHELEASVIIKAGTYIVPALNAVQ